MEEDVALIHLRRITGWNSPNYNPQEDKYFIEDALWSISRKIRPYELTKQEIENFLNIAINEYNKVSDTKISDAERQEIVNSFDEEMIDASDIDIEQGFTTNCLLLDLIL